LDLKNYFVTGQFKLDSSDCHFYPYAREKHHDQTLRFQREQTKLAAKNLSGLRSAHELAQELGQELGPGFVLQ
jgi:hypothetical protein